MQDQFFFEKKGLLREIAALKSSIASIMAEQTERLKRVEEKFNRRPKPGPAKIEPSEAALKKKVLELEKEISQAQVKIIGLTKKNDFLKIQLENLKPSDRESCVTILEKLKNLYEARTAFSTEQAEEEMPETGEELKAALARVTGQRDALNADVEKLVAAVEKRVKEIKTLEAKVKSLTDKGIKLLVDNQEATMLVAGFQQQTDFLQSRINVLEEDLKQVTAERDASILESTGRLEEQQHMHEKFSHEIEEMAKLKETIEESKHHVALSKSLWEEQRSLKEEAEGKVGDLEVMINALHMEILHVKYPTGAAAAALLPEVEEHSQFTKMKLPTEGKKHEHHKHHPHGLSPITDETSYEKLKEELEALRSKVLCCLCREQFSNSLIKKCGHIFCHHCLNINVSSRNRKCPSCHQKFQTDDIIKIFFK